MNHAVAPNVVRRFLSRSVLADDRLRPPLSIVEAVDTGKLDPQVLAYWHEVVQRLISAPVLPKDRGSMYAAAVEFWRNKCNKYGCSIPKEYMKGLGGEGSQGRWTTKPGDQVEEWVKQTLISNGLMKQVDEYAASWQDDLRWANQEIVEMEGLIKKHTEGMAKAKSPAGVAQRKKWLEAAEGNFAQYKVEINKANAKVAALAMAAAKKPQVNVIAIEFEKEFQFMMGQALTELSKKQVMDSVKKAMERFENGLDMPETPEAGKMAGILEGIGALLEKAWNYVKGAFEHFIDWVAGVEDVTKKIESMMNEAGA